MSKITQFLDRTSQFLLQPSNKKFTPSTRALAWAVTIITGLATLGLLQAACAIWRKVHHVKQPNPQQQQVNQVGAAILQPTPPVTTTPVVTTPVTTTPVTTTPVTPPVVTPPVVEAPATLFSSSDLMTFRAALKKAAAEGFTGDKAVAITLGGKTYRVWHNEQYKAINLQEEWLWKGSLQDGKIGLIIGDDGTITSIYVDGQKQNNLDIPEKFQEGLKAGFKEALKRSSKYTFNPLADAWSAPIQIQAVRRGLKELPDFHLENLSRGLKKACLQINDPKIKVEFLKDDLTFDAGIDAGGLTRDYLDDLMSGLVAGHPEEFKKGPPADLVFPSSTKGTPASPIPHLDAEEKNRMQSLGRLMMFCYNSQEVGGPWQKAYTLGVHVDHSLFEGVKTLTAQEVNTPFESLQLPTIVKMSRALLETREIAFHDTDNATLLKRLDWLEKFDTLTDSELTDVAKDVGLLMEIDIKFGDLNDAMTAFVPNLEGIKSNKEEFKKLLLEATFHPPGMEKPLGSELAAIHSIAQGMKELCNPGPHPINADQAWTQFSAKNALEVSSKIQGEVNREELIQKFDLDASIPQNERQEINKKVGWLKDWIKDEASSDELRKALKYFTGGTSMPKGKRFTVKNQPAVPKFPVPKAHTCSFEMNVAGVPSSYGTYNDHTKDNFIKAFKDLVLSNPAAYGEA